MAVEETRWGMIYCPKKGFFQRNNGWEKIGKHLDEYGIQYDFIQSENKNSVERLVNMLINNGYKTIIIVGGDIALNDAVNCLMRTDKNTRDNISLGVIPNGGVNDFSRFWGYRDGEIEDTIKWIKEKRTRKIDLGCINYTDKNGEKHNYYFHNCVNVGLVATIMKMRQQTQKISGSRIMSYVFSFVMMIFQRLEYKMHLKINTDVLKRKIMTVCVGNATGYGQTPSAVPYNGLLDVSVVYHPEIMQLIEGFYLLFTDKFLNHKNVHPYRTQKVEFYDTSHAITSIDGRVVPTPEGPFEVTVKKEVINFIIPQ